MSRYLTITFALMLLLGCEKKQQQVAKKKPTGDAQKETVNELDSWDGSSHLNNDIYQVKPITVGGK